MKLNQVLTLETSEKLKDLSGGIGTYNKKTDKVFCQVLNKKLSAQGQQIAGQPATVAGLEVTIRAENLEKLLKADKIKYKTQKLYFDGLPLFTPLETKYLVLNAKFSSTIQYK